MQFPERPTCHDADFHAQQTVKAGRHPGWPACMPNLFNDVGYIWAPGGHREQELKQVPDGTSPTGSTWRETGAEQWISEPFRRCGYCGSIHPQDLLAAIEAGAQLNGSDWKYGWPHKFYVDEIPNPEPERLFRMGSRSEGGRIVDVTFAKKSSLHAKWYNTHLLDDGFDEEARAQLIAALDLHAGIAFTIVEGKLHYRAPHAGYQRTHLKFDGHPALQQPNEG